MPDPDPAAQPGGQVAARVRWVNRRVYVDLAGVVNDGDGQVMADPFAVVELSAAATTRLLPVLERAERVDGDVAPPVFFVDAPVILPEAIEEWAVDTVELWWKARTAVEGAARR